MIHNILEYGEYLRHGLHRTTDFQVKKNSFTNGPELK